MNLLKQALRKDSKDPICNQNKDYLINILDLNYNPSYVSKQLVNDIYKRNKTCSYTQNKKIDNIVYDILDNIDLKNDKLSTNYKDCFKNKRIRSPKCVKKFLIESDKNINNHLDIYADNNDLNYIYIQNIKPLNKKDKNSYDFSDYENLLYKKGFFSKASSPFHLYTLKYLLNKQKYIEQEFFKQQEEELMKIEEENKKLQEKYSEFIDIDKIKKPKSTQQKIIQINKEIYSIDRFNEFIDVYPNVDKYIKMQESNKLSNYKILSELTKFYLQYTTYFSDLMNINKNFISDITKLDIKKIKRDKKFNHNLFVIPNKLNGLIDDKTPNIFKLGKKSELIYNHPTLEDYKMQKDVTGSFINSGVPLPITQFMLDNAETENNKKTKKHINILDIIVKKLKLNDIVINGVFSIPTEKDIYNIIRLLEYIIILVIDNVQIQNSSNTIDIIILSSLGIPNDQTLLNLFNEAFVLSQYVGIFLLANEKSIKYQKDIYYVDIILSNKNLENEYKNLLKGISLANNIYGLNKNIKVRVFVGSDEEIDLLNKSLVISESLIVKTEQEREQPKSLSPKSREQKSPYSPINLSKLIQRIEQENNKPIHTLNKIIELINNNESEALSEPGLIIRVAEVFKDNNDLYDELLNYIYKSPTINWSTLFKMIKDGLKLSNIMTTPINKALKTPIKSYNKSLDSIAKKLFDDE